ncbi:MAG: hypothetical protein PHP50_04275 [Lachnospiraceae bacterium]|nr:hypothetical protein [Lachnospiraceae bacterium]
MIMSELDEEFIEIEITVVDQWKDIERLLDDNDLFQNGEILNIEKSNKNEIKILVEYEDQNYRFCFKDVDVFEMKADLFVRYMDEIKLRKVTEGIEADFEGGIGISLRAGNMIIETWENE